MRAEHPKRSFEGSVVAITGASRGIGHALIPLFLKAGASVFACARTSLDLPSHPKLTCTSVDVTNRSQVMSWAAQIQDTRGVCDLLIHNASVLGPTGPLGSLDPEAWQRTIEVNLNGSFYITQAFLPLLLHASNPLALFMSSSVGRKARGEWGAYCASKFGLEALVGMLAQEQPSITAASFNPGGTRTQMRAEAYPDEDPKTLPSAEHIAEVLFWLSQRLTQEDSGQPFNARDLAPFRAP